MNITKGVYMACLTQNTKDWLDFRKNKIGASDAPIILGISPWKTAYQLWLEKLDIVSSDFQSKAMSRGLQMENEARINFSLFTGIEVEPKVMIHPKRDWMMCSLDGISKDEQFAVEIKCPGEKDHSIASSGRIPDKYYPQLQHQLEVCGLDMIYYYSFDGYDGCLIEVERDEKFISQMISKEEKFYECLQNFVSPTLTDRDYVQKKDELWEIASTNWKSVKSQLDAVEKQEKELRDVLISMADNKNIMGGGLKMTKCIRKGCIDYSQIPEIKNVDLEKYRKESTQYYKINVA